MFPLDLLVAAVIGYAAGVLFFFARTLGTWPRTIAFVLLGTVVFGGAALTRHGGVMVRCALGMVPIILVMHMWDLHLDPERARRLTLREYAVWLPDYGWSVARVPAGYGVELSWPRRGRDAARYVAGLCLVSILVAGVFRVDWHEYGFWPEHAAKAIGLGAWCVWVYNANTALWRLAGAPAALFTEKNVLGASSLAEFWRRWNRPMYRWLLENVYKPVGGARRPYEATLASFVLSGLLHEYLYAVTFRRVTGYFLAFFLLHGAATALTRRLRPQGRLMVPAAILTFAFNTLSAVVLLIPINEAIGVYANDVPNWLRLW